MTSSSLSGSWSSTIGTLKQRAVPYGSIRLFRFNKSYKVFYVQKCQRQSCKAFIGLTIRAKMIGKGQLLVSEILDQIDCVGAKSPIFDLFSLIATQP